MTDRKKRALLLIITLIFTLIVPTLFAQEVMEEEKKERIGEFYFGYQVNMAYYEELIAPSLLGAGFGVGFEMGSHKPFWRNVGIGLAYQWQRVENSLKPDLSLDLFHIYPNVYYSYPPESNFSWQIKLGLGVGISKDLEELASDIIDNVSAAGPLYVFEWTASIEEKNRWQLRTGINFSYLNLNGEHLFISSPLLRMSYGF